MPITPSKGASIAFCSSMAVSRITLRAALAAVSLRHLDRGRGADAALLQGAGALELGLAELQDACAAARSARSISSRIWRSGWPVVTRSLAAKRISATMPPASTARSTPRAAPAVPMA
jgi:hypothetical protein